MTDWQSWLLFVNHGLPLNPLVCWTSDERCRGEQLREAADGDTRDAWDAIGPFQLYYFVLSGLNRIKARTKLELCAWCLLILPR